MKSNLMFDYVGTNNVDRNEGFDFYGGGGGGELCNDCENDQSLGYCWRVEEKETQGDCLNSSNYHGDIENFHVPLTRGSKTDCKVHYGHNDYRLREIPSFLNRIIAPPIEFADDQNDIKLKAELNKFDVESVERTGGYLRDHNKNSNCTLKGTEHSSSVAGRSDQNFIQPHSYHFEHQLDPEGELFYLGSTSVVGDMGWGQPNTGKRCRDENGGDEHHQEGYLASESETDEELRAHLMNKRSRDVSPVRLTQGNTDLTRGDCSKSSDLVLADCADSISDASEPSLYNEASSCSSIISTTNLTLPPRRHDNGFSRFPRGCSDETDDDDGEDLFRLLPPQNGFLLQAEPANRGFLHATAAVGTTVALPDLPQGSSHDQALMGCPRLPHKRLVRPKPVDAMVVSKVDVDGISSSSSASSSENVTIDREDSPTRIVPKFKGPRVPASRGARLPAVPRRKHISPGLSRTAKSVKGKAVATALAVAAAAAAKEAKEAEDEEQEEEFEGDNVDDDGVGLKGDEAVEDDASTSTDITLPNVVRNVVPPIRPSYFPYVPPYINFCMHDEKSEVLPAEIRKHLKWRMSTITPVVIRKTVGNSGFRLLKKTVEWGGQWGKHMKGAMFRSTLKDYQKLNHLPATFQLGRKDRLWKNVYRFILKYGKTQYGFLPRTYILPHDMKQLKYAWDASESRGNMWIVKPPAGARGTGIRVINKWNQVPKKKPVIVQQYIAKPLLINDRKFDLRLYVLVTSFHPLRVYLYNDGLVRFAPVKYSQDSKRVSDRYMHLTNYSINKNCDLYTQNEDANACKGHKWTLKTLWRVLKGQGVDTQAVVRRIEDIIIKTLISAEECITASSFHMPNRYNGYELFGFDVILDENYKPWLLEVNISPSLHSSSPLDLAVKGPLVKEVFNIVGYHLPPLLTKQARKTFVERLDKELELEKPTFDKRVYTNLLSKEDKAKQALFKAKCDDRSQYLKEIVETLTPDDIRHLIVAEDELSQCSGFNRIFPTRQTHSYFGFFEGPRYYNMLMDAWENKYDQDRAAGIVRLQELCRRKIHLSTVSTGAQPTSPENQEEKCDDAGGDGDVSNGRRAFTESLDSLTSSSGSEASVVQSKNAHGATFNEMETSICQQILSPPSKEVVAAADSFPSVLFKTADTHMLPLRPPVPPAPLKVEHHYVIPDNFGSLNHHHHHHHHLTPAMTCHHQSLPDENRLTSNMNGTSVSNNNSSAASNTPNVSEYKKIKGVCY